MVPGTYVIDEPATAGWLLTGLDCVGQQASTVDIVGATATIGLAPGENVACTYTNSRRGPVKVLKTLTNGPTIVSGNVYTVGYDLAVTSESSINELYNLSDVLDFGTGTTIVSATLTTVDGPAPNVAGWDGVSQTQIQNQALINPSTVDANGHTYHVDVTFAVAGSMTVAARDCVLGADESGTGTLNTASVSSALGSNTSSDCGAIPNPLVSLGKTISAGPTRDAAGVWTIQYKVTVGNSGDWSRGVLVERHVRLRHRSHRDQRGSLHKPRRLDVLGDQRRGDDDGYATQCRRLARLHHHRHGHHCGEPTDERRLLERWRLRQHSLHHHQPRRAELRPSVPPSRRSPSSRRWSTMTAARCSQATSP